MFVLHLKHCSAELEDKQFNTARGVGAGSADKGTLEVDLKEQEGMFHEDEIKVGVGGGGKGVSGAGIGMCQGTGEQENLACLGIKADTQDVGGRMGLGGEPMDA